MPASTAMHGLAERLSGKDHLKGKEISRTFSTAAVAATVSKHPAAEDLASEAVHIIHLDHTDRVSCVGVYQRNLLVRGRAAHFTHTEGSDKLPQRLEHLKISHKLGVMSERETSQLDSTFKLDAVKKHAEATGRSMYKYTQEEINAVEAPRLTAPERPKHAAPTRPLLVNDPDLERGIANAEPIYAPKDFSPHNRSGSDVHPLRPQRVDRFPASLASEAEISPGETIQKLGRQAKTLRETEESNKLMKDSGSVL